VARVLLLYVRVQRRYGMELLNDPVVLSLFGKVVGGVIFFLLAIGFVPGLIIGWLVGKAT
jgi:hypothetical protein